MSTKGRHESPERPPIPTLDHVPPNELGPNENARQSWQEGHEAAVEEMNDPKMSGIKGYYLMYFAIHNDMPLTSEQVKKVWDDAFLTNVIVPILEHIKRHDDNLLGEAYDDGDPVLEAYYARRMVDLDHVQDILKEWRG